jgi:hypothetical protein
MALQRPVLIELDEHGHPRREGAAESAYVLLHDAPRAGLEGKPRLMVSIRLKNVRGRDPVQGIFSNELSPVLTLEIPDAFQDDPKFLTFGQLSLLREHPERMNWIESQRRELSIEIARSIVVDDLAGSIASRGTFVLHDPEGRTLTVSCAGISAIPASPGHFALLLPNGRNEIEVHRTALAVPSRGSGSDVRLFASGATLAPALIDEMGVASVQFRLDLSTVRSVTQDGDAGGVLGQVALGGLLPAQSPLDQFRESPVAKLVPEALRLARERPQSSDAVVRIAAHLDADVADLGREITSKRHERLALAACCLIMVITGSVTALKFSLRLPLTVYLWSFFPALLGIITIAGGQQLTHGKGEWGLVLLWGGVAGLLAYTLVAYRGVARH